MFDPKSDETIGYHLFLEPQGPLASELTRIITALSQEYQGPVFTPHVTLLARIPDEEEGIVIAKCRELASQLSPIPLTLGPLRSEDAYFRALYSEIVDQDEVREYHRKAAIAFGMEQSPAYLPHFSLLYGNYPEEIKAQTRSLIELPETRTFAADTIHLYKTPGNTDTWVKVGEFPMGD